MVSKGIDDICNTALGLGLGLGLGCFVKQENLTQLDHPQQNNKELLLKHDHFLPSLLSLPLGSSDDTKTDACRHQQQASSLSAASSFSNSRTVQKERDDQDLDLERISSRASDEDEDGSPRKKLRLTKQQSSILEDIFKEHITLNPKQKQALGEKLNLRTRQVEVWFQNRRARTKLKQTEVECELLKKCYEALTEENKKLHKEVQELKAMKLTTPHYMQMQVSAAVTMCPCCESERVVDVNENPSRGTFALEQKSQFFSHPSAAC